LILLFLFPLLIINIIDYFALPEDIETQQRITIEISKGATLAQIADTLSFYNLVKNKSLFIFWAKSLGFEKKLKAGLFQVPVNLTYAQLLAYLATAKPKEIFVTLIEGWNNNQFAYQLSRKLGINQELFISLCNDEEFISGSGLTPKNLTGYLLPDTYGFYWGISEKEIIKYLLSRTRDVFARDSVIAAMQKLQMDMHNILTLASIIEGEAILDSERAVISSVYHNRLERGMLLQADPTIQYLIPGPPRRLLLKDLDIASPYNTYRYSGLPPGPINNPGIKSVLAALYPAETNYLYFVAVGDGSHNFSRTAAEHSRAKSKFNKVRRQVRKNQRNMKDLN